MMNESITPTQQSTATDIGSDKPYWPYWSIHGRLYDLTPWLDEHPGGADFLHRCRGIDCTAAFEIHHLRMPRAQAMLRRFEVTEQSAAATPPSAWPQFDWAHYSELRERVAKRLAEMNWRPGPSLRGILIAVSALAINLTIPFIWGSAGHWQWLLGFIYAVNMIIITGFGHVFLHLNTHWQHLGDLSNFSSHLWKTEHCLRHHLYTNHPTLDPDVTKLWPILHFSPEYRNCWQPYYAPLLVVPLYALAFMALRLMRPLEMLRDSHNLTSRLLWYAIGSFGWLILWWWVGYLWVGILLECLASFLFLSLTLSNHNHTACHQLPQRPDFVTYQMQACYDFGNVNYWESLLLSAFLGSQTLHHLFPTLDPSYYHIVEEELQAMGYGYQRHSFWSTYWDHLRFISR